MSERGAEAVPPPEALGTIVEALGTAATAAAAAAPAASGGACASRALSVGAAAPLPIAAAAATAATPGGGSAATAGSSNSKSAAPRSAARMRSALRQRYQRLTMTQASGTVTMTSAILKISPGTNGTKSVLKSERRQAPAPATDESPQPTFAPARQSGVFVWMARPNGYQTMAGM